MGLIRWSLNPVTSVPQKPTWGFLAGEHSVAFSNWSALFWVDGNKVWGWCWAWTRLQMCLNNRGSLLAARSVMFTILQWGRCGCWALNHYGLKTPKRWSKRGFKTSVKLQSSIRILHEFQSSMLVLKILIHAGSHQIYKAFFFSSLIALYLYPAIQIAFIFWHSLKMHSAEQKVTMEVCGLSGTLPLKGCC